MTPQTFRVVEGVLALLALVPLALLRRRPRDARRRRLAAAALALTGVVAWTNFGQFHIPWFVHLFDMFHYYVGAKYLPELQYTRLYDCAVVAGTEDAGKGVPPLRTVRNLATKRIEPVDRVLSHYGECRQRFSAARWNEFKSDVSWFRSQMSPERWHALLSDHGFNATPVWALLGTPLANAVPLSERNLALLAGIDIALLAAMWAVVTWAFGLEVAAVAMLFWGVNMLGEFSVTGGSLLRYGWLFCLVAGIAFLRRGRDLAAGFLLALSALLRVFPAIVLFVLAVRWVLRAARRRRLRPRPRERRLAAGVALAALPLVGTLAYFPLSGGLWQAFGSNIVRHSHAPFFNSVSLAAALSYAPEYSVGRVVDFRSADPWAVWRERRAETLASRGWLWILLVAAFVALLVPALLRSPPWVGAVLGIGLMPVLLEQILAYYLVALLAFALLWRRAPGVVLLLFATAHLFLYPVLPDWYEDSRFFYSTLPLLAFLYAATALLAFRGRSHGARGGVTDAPDRARARQRPAPGPESPVARGQGRRHIHAAC